MALKTIPKPSETSMATMPHNEERRAQAVVKTGLVDAPNSDLFQIYCDLARDLTGFEQAKFSLFDGELQCSMAAHMLMMIMKLELSMIGQNGMCVPTCCWIQSHNKLLHFTKTQIGQKHPHIRSGDAHLRGFWL